MKNLLIILSILISSVGYGISPSEKVDVNNIDVEYLEGLVFEKINEYRLSKGLNILELNESEINYSRKHSERMVKEERGLFHDIKSSEEPIDGVRTSLENCANSIISPIMVVSYDDIAKDIIKQWKKSPAHNESLLDESIYLGEIGITLNIETLIGVEGVGMVYATYRGWGI
jgi:uncharacterized protein YkwD